MPLTPEEKAARARQRMLDTAAKYQIGTYKRKVAAVFQKMIRAEWAARPAGPTMAIVDGRLAPVHRTVGQCVCVTCGSVAPWKAKGRAGGGMDAGHFIQGRGNSVLFEEAGVAPQCVVCNQHGSGEQQLFRKWLVCIRGPSVVRQLERLKNETRKFTREELVDMKISYSARLKAAEEAMKEGDNVT